MGRKRTTERRLRSRIVAALLAGGVVLGVGAIVTIAAWTDQENATGSFAASVFDIESQSAGSGTYASRPTAPGAMLTFNATAMSPGVSYYAWLNIRSSTTTTVAGTVTLTSATSTGGLAPALQYRMVRMANASPTSTCAAAVFTGSTFIAGDAATYLAANTVPGTAVSSTIALPAGTALGFCVEVRIAPGSANSYQGTTGSVTWAFTGTSG